MKKVLGLLIFFTLMGCESKEGIQIDISQLKAERQFQRQLKQDVVNDISILTTQKNKLYSEVQELKIWNNEKRAPNYIMKLKLKQSHISLSIKKHMKDAANAVELEIPVSKEYYDQHSIGSKLLNKFRGGSAILYGSYGNWKITVVGKRIE